MSDGSLSRTRISPAKPTQSVGFKSTAKQSALSRKSSTKALPTRRTVSFSPDSEVIVIRDSQGPAPSAPEAQKPAMFSTFFSHTQAHLPRGQHEMEKNDFDHTPPPSVRSSIDMLRDDNGQPDIANEPRTAQGAGFPHHSPKPSTSGGMVVSKDHPIAPILSLVLEPQKIILRPRNVKLEHENQGTLSAEKFPPSPFMLSQSSELLHSTPATKRIRIESLMHTHDTHAHPHTQRLVNAAGSCDTTEENQDEIPIWPSPDYNLLGSPEVEIGGLTDKGKTAPHVREQTRSAKVHPAFNHDPIDHREQAVQVPGGKPNKVSPYDPILEYAEHQPENNDKLRSKAMGKNGKGARPTTFFKQTPSTKSACAVSERKNSLKAESNTSSQAPNYRQSRSGSTDPVGRSQSLGSILDYMRTSQWLRDLANQPGSHDTRFTQLPTRAGSSKESIEYRRPSEPLLPSTTASRRLTGRTSVSSKLDPQVDGLMFRRAVSDLERLLNEALSLASQVADQSEAAATADNRHYFDPFPDGRRSSSSSEQSMHSAQESMNLSIAEKDTPPCPTRPRYKHAATYTCSSKRPRLADIVQNYSGGKNLFGSFRDLKTRMFGERPQTSETFELSPQHVPTRRSNDQGGLEQKQRILRAADDPTNTNSLIAFSCENENLPGPTSLQKRSAAAHTTAAGRNATGQDALPGHSIAGRKLHGEHGISLRRRSHSPVRKRFVASVACLSTALIGIILGIYTGLVPSIQYYIVDQSHVTIHGNTGCFLALALPSFFLWPLPLLHGRKPYIISSLAIAMPLLFPQAIAVSSQRLTNTASWRALLLASRALMGGSLGFASMNFHSVLTDLFGASLMHRHPHQEVVDQFDARRHGGGMGVWLGIWTWCWIGSLGIGFLIGAAIIDKHPPAWGFYVSIMLIALVLLLNVICPEVRRSPFRRSVAEVRTGEDISRRLARGEVMMHRVKTGPKWWGQEVYHGIRLSIEMLQQPGFAVMTAYVAWIYAQVVLVIILLGSLASRFYRLRSPHVGLHVAAITLGALLAIPFQKANIFSRSRHREGNNSRDTLDKKIAWSSHLVRRAIFTVSLPIGAACYAAVSSGPPINLGVPTFFALCIGFLSSLAVSECNGLIMETFDTSDLCPGMVGRHLDHSGQDQRRTNYSSFPRVTAGFAIIHSFAFILAAGATALGGHITRKLGQQVATGVVAGILFILTVLLLLVLIRFRNVLIVPRSKSEEMDKLTQARRRSTKRRASMPNDPRAMMEEDFAWRPVMIGNPTGKNRRMNVLELGNMTRWQDILRRNKLIDAGVHINHDTLDLGLDALDAALENHIDGMRRDGHGLFKRGSVRKHGGHLRRSNQSSDQTFHDMELDMLDPAATPSEPPQPRQFVERECVMGQTVKEENEDEAQAGPSGSRRY
ncbi:hypothetical protein FZEAL_7846 [Fusarium zealandicum]|uniref:Uncharacterized protein n=1 Tax=Fusarium zealandicum TaxID=1053134 RepID=A0A8H4XHG6_9HYPO|nr:hypothetical protein FZEAL_7846 [Fusarium zealandicum]